MPRLSIIICLYNTDSGYFEECLAKIFSSTLLEKEVIVVDDGSSQDYSEILAKYNQVVYIKTDNQGTLKARALGAKMSTAPYVCYVDSDDTISFCFHEACIVKAEKTGADVVINDWAFDINQTKYVCLADSLINEDIDYNNKEILKAFFEQQGGEHSYYVLWNKIFKRELLLSAFEKIDKTDIDRLLLAEDLLICYFVFTKCTKVVNVHVGYYFYRVHKNQQTLVAEKNKLKNHVAQSTKVFSILQEHLKDIGLFEEVGQNLFKWKQLMCAVHVAQSKKFEDKDLTEYILSAYQESASSSLPKNYGKSYLKQRVLPNNIEEIDEELLSICNSKQQIKVYAKKSSYQFELLTKIKGEIGGNFQLVSKKDATLVLKEQKISIKKKILHNTFVYKIGMMLFPKGSKLREKLKMKL